MRLSLAISGKPSSAVGVCQYAGASRRTTAADRKVRLADGGNNDPDLFLEQRPVWSADGLINGEQVVGWPRHDLGCAGGPAYIFLRQVAGGTPT